MKLFGYEFRIRKWAELSDIEKGFVGAVVWVNSPITVAYYLWKWLGPVL